MTTLNMSSEREKYPKSCVYWIYLLDAHTDPFTQGYIGVSVNGARRRFKAHMRSARDGSTLKVHNAIRKYGDRVSFKTIIEGSPEYCLMIEEKMRPVEYMKGTWNMCRGGFSKQAGISPSEEVRKKLSEANKGLIRSEETRNRLSEANKGKTLKESTKELLRIANLGKKSTPQKLEKMRERMKKIGPWGHSYSNKFVWSCAEKAYRFVKENSTLGPQKLANMLGCSKDACTTMLRHLKNGWCPSVDVAYLDWLEKYEKECNESTLTT